MLLNCLLLGTLVFLNVSLFENPNMHEFVWTKLPSWLGHTALATIYLLPFWAMVALSKAGWRRFIPFSTPLIHGHAMTSSLLDSASHLAFATPALLLLLTEAYRNLEGDFQATNGLSVGLLRVRPSHQASNLAELLSTGQDQLEESEAVIIIFPMALGLVLSFFKTHRCWIELFSSRLRLRRKTEQEYREIGEKMVQTEKPSLCNHLSNGYFNISHSLVPSAQQATTDVQSLEEGVEFSRADTISTIHDRDVHLQIGFNDPFNELRSARSSFAGINTDSNLLKDQLQSPENK